MEDATTTVDGVLNRRVELEQPVLGYRVAIDTVFLAAAVPAFPGDHILDMGCGVGGAMLSLACRVKGISGWGVEIQEFLFNICQRNIQRNKFAASLRAEWGDVTALGASYTARFDHVLMNPPFHSEINQDPSPHRMKQLANSEKEGDLAKWLGAADRALKPSGMVTLIHRYDRRDELLDYLRGSFGDVQIMTIFPKKDAAPHRLILRARKQALFSVTDVMPLIVHENKVGYTKAAEQILRQAQALEFQSP